MSNRHEKYLLADADLYNVRNRNELRVIRRIVEIMESGGLVGVGEDVIRDIYAYALNQIPARYTQQGTIVLRDPVKDDDIEKIVAEAILYISHHPKS